MNEFPDKRDGVVLRSYGAYYHVLAGSSEYTCTLRGRFRLEEERLANPVAVGDRVVILPSGPDTGVIEEIRPRSNRLSRKSPGRDVREQLIAANIDQLVVISSVLEPPLNTRMIDRFLVAAEKGDFRGIVCINKVDLKMDDEIDGIGKCYTGIGYDVLLTSAVSGRGIDEFGDLLKGRISVLAGVSGVGKSSLLNVIRPGLNLPVRRISSFTGKGKHTTSSVQLIPLGEGGGFVADTPGLRELGLWKIRRRELAEYFPEMEECFGHCRFNPCYHVHEPGCLVKERLADGRIDPRRYESYVRILETLEE